MLHLVAYLYYWQMEFNSVFKGLMCYKRQDEREFEMNGDGRCFYPLKYEVLLNNNSHLDSVFLSRGMSFESHTTASSTGTC